MHRDPIWDRVFIFILDELYDPPHCPPGAPPRLGERMPTTTDQKARAEQLAEQLKEKEAIINGISDGLMLLDASTYEILEVNQALLAYYGVSRDEVMGKH